jgi:sRNA-binding carbon storage regulator CsrA
MEKGILLMLILTRRTNELIHIYPDDLPPDMTVAELFADGQISIEVLGLKGNQVKLGIHAPKSLTILRDDANELP